MTDSTMKSGGLFRIPMLHPAAIACGLLVIWGLAPKGVDFARSVQAQENSEGEFDPDPPVRTERELEHLLERAKLFADGGQYNHATTLWQKVLEDSADTLIKESVYPEQIPGGPKQNAIIEIYMPLARSVERAILKVPKAGLRIYRISADPPAKSLLSKGADANEEEALAEIVRRYFLSTHGDDAAYKLGCIALDRYDFVGAGRLLQKIVSEHPDPSVPLGEVWLRIAVAAAHVGDFGTAKDALENLAQAPGRPRDELVALVRADIERVRITSETVDAKSHEWSMIGGGPNRAGHMKRLPAEVTKSNLTKAWEYRFDIDFTARAPNAPPVFLPRKNVNQPVQLTSGSFKDLMAKWTAGGWMPSGHMLLADGKIFLKTNERLTCWSAEGSDDVVWASAWSNDYRFDEATQMIHQMFGNRQQPGQTDPFSKTEVQLFGDRIHQQMSIANDTVYSIEGPRLGLNDTPNIVAAQPQRFGFRGGMVPRRARKNFLAAYDLKTGKAKWHRSANDEEKGETDMGYMAAPVPFANFLLVPVTEGGTIWLYALSADDGSTVWKTFLSDEPSGGCKPWSPVGISVDGRDAYVVCGTGVVFAVDAVSGDVRFAVRYHRHGNQDPLLRNRFGQNVAFLKLNGWDDDVVIPYNKSMVVMATDHDWLFAVDRRTGEFLWKSPRKPFDHAASYFMGVTADGGYIVGGKNVVRRYDISSGRLIWEQEIEDSFGRGIVTEDAAYVPVKNTIVKLDLKEGTVVNTVAVDTKMKFNDEEYTEHVGNLFSDGDKIWVSAPNGIYALTNPELERAALEKRVLDGDPMARLKRMRLLAREGKIDAAVADLRAAYQELLVKDGAEKAAAELFRGINDIELSQSRPHTTLDLLAESFIKPEQKPELSKDLDNQLADVLFFSLRSMRNQRTVGHASAVLQVIPLLKEEYHYSVARQALAATVQDADRKSIVDAVGSGSASAQIVATEALAKLLKQDAKAPLGELLKSPDERVKLAAARGLASLSDPSGLAALVELLDAEDARIRSRSVQLLRSLTGQKFGYSSFLETAPRKQGVQNWRDWVQKNSSTAKLNLPVPDVVPMFGRTLICLFGSNRVVELDAAGKIRWQKDAYAPAACQGLPNGHRLIATHDQILVEFDAGGNEIWRVKNVPDNPYSVRRLENGNTLVACTSQKVVEFRPDGAIAWQANIINRPWDARRLENGNTLVALSGSNQVVELDGEGRPVWNADGLSGVSSAQRLENGNTLVALYAASRVVEIDRDGKEVWVKDVLEFPAHAQRLSNGHTLIAEYKRVIEVDAEGAIVWQHAVGGAFDVSRF